MANTVNITPLIDGSKVLVYHIYLKSDGATGDLEDEVLLDPKDLGLANEPKFSIDEILFHFAGFDGWIEFDSGLITDTMIWVLPEGSEAYVDFRSFGGLTDRSSKLDGTGKILLNTTGFTSSTDHGSIILKVRVKN